MSKGSLKAAWQSEDTTSGCTAVTSSKTEKSLDLKGCAGKQERHSSAA